MVFPNKNFLTKKKQKFVFTWVCLSIARGPGWALTGSICGSCTGLAVVGASHVMRVTRQKQIELQTLSKANVERLSLGMEYVRPRAAAGLSGCRWMCSDVASVEELNKLIVLQKRKNKNFRDSPRLSALPLIASGVVDSRSDGGSRGGCCRCYVALGDVSSNDLHQVSHEIGGRHWAPRVAVHRVLTGVGASCTWKKTNNLVGEHEFFIFFK